MLPVPGCKFAKSSERVLDPDSSGDVGAEVGVGYHPGCTAFKCLCGIGIAIEILSLEREEHLSAIEGPGVGADSAAAIQILLV